MSGLDAIVLDIGLPDLNGLELARRIRNGGSAVPILMLTARDAVRDRVAGLDAGADDYLVKPFAYEELSRQAAGPRPRAASADRSAARPSCGWAPSSSTTHAAWCSSPGAGSTSASASSRCWSA